MKKKSHCQCLMVSFNKKIEKMAANIGAKYLKDTAVPIGIYLVDINNKINVITSTILLSVNYFLLWPKEGILFVYKYPEVKTNVPSDLKKTISNARMSTKYLTALFMHENANALTS